MTIIMGPGLTDLAKWRQRYHDGIVKCMRKKGYDEATLKMIGASGFTVLGGAIAATVLALDLEECDKIVCQQIGPPPYDEMNGNTNRDGNGYDVSIKWDWIDRQWPIDNDIKWTYKIHCNSDDIDEFLSSIKILFKDNVEDLFDQTEIPKSIKITCDGEPIDTTTWSMTVEGNCIHWKVEEGFENIQGAKKCCTIEIEMTVEADGFTDLGSAFITVNRGKQHDWGDGVAVPGPVLAASSLPEGPDFLASQRIGSIGIRPEYKHLTPQELLSSPIDVLAALSSDQISALKQHFNIQTVKDLSFFRHSRIITDTKKVHKATYLDTLKKKDEALRISLMGINKEKNINSHVGKRR